MVSKGIPIGFCMSTDKKHPVCIPDYLRTRHVHVIGCSCMGKSTAMEFMVLHDIQQNQGVAVIDPYGRLVQRLLGLIPEEHADRVIYFNPGDPDWIPLWNPLRCRSTQGIGRVADDLVRAFKSFFSGWGDRLEHLLRQSILAVLHLPGGSLLDVLNILRQKSEESRLLRAQILKIIDNELLRNFWEHDFDRYGPADLIPLQSKFSKLLTSKPVALMLLQSDSAFDFQSLMDSGKILLVDLSNTGPEVREILGCFTLSLLHLAGLGRGSGPAFQNRPYHIYCDEAHRFMTDAMEDMIEENRKFGVSLTLAHQQLSQFNIRKIDSFSNVGSTIIFKVGTKDAQFLMRDLQDLVEQKDLITLDVGQAIARIGTEVVRIRTNGPLEIPEKNCRDRIIEQSHAQYYRPANEVKRAIRNREELEAGPLASYRPEDIDKKSTPSPRSRNR